MAWGTSSGTVAAANAKTASATYTSGAITCSSGDTIVLVVSFDNVTNASTPTINTITKAGSETASWVRIASHNSSTATGGSGIRTEVWAIQTAVAWSAFSPVVTLSNSVTAKSSIGKVFNGGTGGITIRSGTAPTGGTSTTSAPTFTLTGADQPQTGDLVIGAAGFETGTTATGDSDTSNGSWSTAVTGGSTGGTDNTNSQSILQWKIVTGTGDQTYNPTNATSTDSGATAVALVPTPENKALVSRVHAETLYSAVTDAQVSRIHLETLYDWPNRRYASMSQVDQSLASFNSSGTSMYNTSLVQLDYPLFEREFFIIAGALDNASGSATTPTVSWNTPSNETATWTTVYVDSPVTANASGVRGFISYIYTTVPWSYIRGFTLQGTLSTSIVAKSTASAVQLGPIGVSPPSGIGSNTANATGTGSIQIAPTGTPDIGDAWLILAASEGGDSVITGVPNLLVNSPSGGTGTSGVNASLGYVIYDGTNLTTTVGGIQDGGLIALPLQFGGKVLPSSWNVLTRVQKTQSNTWDVSDTALTRVDKTTQSESWDVYARVQKTTAESWETLARVQKTASQTYEVLARVQKTASQTYNVAFRDSKTASQTWNVASRVLKTASQSWEVIGRVQKTLDESWGVGGRVQKTTAESWEVLSRVQKTASQTYEVLSRTQKTTSETWNVASRVQKTTSETWNTGARVQKTLDESWSLGGRVAQTTQSETWDVRARVAKTASQTYNVKARVAKSTSETWNVALRVSKTVTENWEVAGRGQKFLDQSWSVDALVRVNKTDLTTTWNAQVRVTKSSIQRWNLKFRVQKTTAQGTWTVTCFMAWDGTQLKQIEWLGIWDGSALQPAEIGMWDGTALVPFD